MGKFLSMMVGFSAGAIGIVIVLFVLLLMARVVIADEATRTYEATIGQQDRSLKYEEYEGYDNSDFLRDMDRIANGTYVEALEPADAVSAEEEYDASAP